MLQANNTIDISRQTNNQKSNMLLFKTSYGTSTISLTTVFIKNNILYFFLPILLNTSYLY